MKGNIIVRDTVKGNIIVRGKISSNGKNTHYNKRTKRLQDQENIRIRLQRKTKSTTETINSRNNEKSALIILKGLSMGRGVTGNNERYVKCLITDVCVGIQTLWKDLEE